MPAFRHLSLSPCMALADGAGVPQQTPVPVEGGQKKSSRYPQVLSTLIAPPINSTSCLEMANPRPVPPNLRVIEPSTWLKGTNNLCSAFWGIPMPLSLMLKRSELRPPSLGPATTEILTLPWGG